MASLMLGPGFELWAWADPHINDKSTAQRRRDKAFFSFMPQLLQHSNDSANERMCYSARLMTTQYWAHGHISNQWCSTSGAADSSTLTGQSTKLGVGFIFICYDHSN
jgi:hypothetical protein